MKRNRFYLKLKDDSDEMISVAIDEGNVMMVTENGYYLAGNLVTYQTYYFRGDKTTIDIISSNETEIIAIIYEKWTSNNKNTLAKVKVIKENNLWLVDDVTIIATE